MEDVTWGYQHPLVDMANLILPEDKKLPESGEGRARRHFRSSRCSLPLYRGYYTHEANPIPKPKLHKIWPIVSLELPPLCQCSRVQSFPIFAQSQRHPIRDAGEEWNEREERSTGTALPR